MRTFFLCFSIILTIAACQSAKTDSGTKLPDTLLKTAKDFNFKYLEVRELASKGDTKAIRDFLDFSRKVDNYDGAIHAVDCLELISTVGDRVYAASVFDLKPKLREHVLGRFTEAQTRTKNEALRRPLAEWAPLSLAALRDGVAPQAEAFSNEEGIKRKMQIDSIEKANAAGKQ